jgi:hypothetical protein
MRTALATALVRVACKLVEGCDDRRVVLNTPRRRSKSTGRIEAFVSASHRDRTAVAFEPDFLTGQWGVAVPTWVARLAGWEVRGLHEL